MVLAGLLCLGLAGLIAVPLGPPALGTRGGLLPGPWYMLGLQGMLLDLPVAAGWLAPAGFVGLLGLVRGRTPSGRRWLLVAIVAATLIYVGLSVSLVART